MTADDLRLLFTYNAWANARSVEACASLSHGQFTQEIPSSFHSVRDTLAHICGAEWVWLERLSGRSPRSLLPFSDFPDFPATQGRLAEMDRALVEHAASLGTDDVERIIHYEMTSGAPQAQPQWQMLHHVINHGTYHRGQVTTLLRQLGGKPVSTDLISFFRERSAAKS